MASEHSTPTPDNGQSPIKAIETQYNGYRFRSRLEARWAVVFDTLGVQYQYEPEGYDLDGIWYLPDFYLPHYECWWEVKGNLSDTSVLKAKDLCKFTELTVIIGDDQFNSQVPNTPMFRYSFIRAPLFLGIVNIRDVSWAYCERCGGIAPMAMTKDTGNCWWYRISAMGCKCELGKEWWNPSHSVILNAFVMAKQARFEHGESPRSQ